MLVLCPWLASADERGMSHDDTVAPGAPEPHIAPPGEQAPVPPAILRAPATPHEGAPLQEVGAPRREIQPGEETPQGDPGLFGGGGSPRPPGGELTKDGGHGGSDPGGSDPGGSDPGGSGGPGGGRLGRR